MKQLNLGATASIYAAIIFLAVLSPSHHAAASDLDDGIAIDKDINDDIKPDRNNQFIIIKAKTKARYAQRKGGDKGDVITPDGAGNIAIGAGTDLRGATIINLSDNTGATVISD